jgi:hypothetical protein
MISEKKTLVASIAPMAERRLYKIAHRATSANSVTRERVPKARNLRRRPVLSLSSQQIFVGVIFGDSRAS